MEAQVVCSQIGVGMGLLFTPVEPEQFRMLETWPDELGGGMRGDQTGHIHLPQSDITTRAVTKCWKFSPT
jgi:hypothetical protein